MKSWWLVKGKGHLKNAGNAAALTPGKARPAFVIRPGGRARGGLNKFLGRRGHSEVAGTKKKKNVSAPWKKCVLLPVDKRKILCHSVAG